MISRFIRVLTAACMTLVLNAPAPFAMTVEAPTGVEEPRTIIGIWDNRPGSELRLSHVHALAEMPLNHLGLVVEYHDILTGLPDLSQRSDVRGILIWLADGSLADASGFAQWMEQARARNIPIALLGPVPGAFAADGRPGDSATVARILAVIGLRNLGGWLSYSYDLSIIEIDRGMMEFERKLDGALPPVDIVRPMGEARPLLVLERRNDPATRTMPAIITPEGAYVQTEFLIWKSDDSITRMWRLNPFTFFGEVFHTKGLPAPDTTTLNGRRIYYSHIDGDGWINISLADDYAGRDVICAAVILNEVAIAYPDLPVTVAPIGAEIDPAFGARRDAIDIARRFFALPNVEAASHTYSHPYQWSFFGRDYDIGSDLAFVPYYAKTRIAPAAVATATGERPRLSAGYDLPRAYGDIPFNLRHEISGSIALVNALAPPDRPARLIQWSGDTSPGEEVLAEVRAGGFLNINGGDTRFDGDWPSYAAVAPIGRMVGRERQIYSSQANENLYTDLWRSRFFGFRFLETSLRNTEDPIRISPINIYYHMYSGEREAGLLALKRNLDYARGQAIAPITTSQYAGIASDFYETKLIRLGDQLFAIENRGTLNTIRFDDADDFAVDLARSDGVLGGNRHQGSLYVALEPSHPRPVIALGPRHAQSAAVPELIESRWSISDVVRDATRVSFSVQGFGPGEMVWRVAPHSVWDISGATARPGATVMSATADDDGYLSFTLPDAPSLHRLSVILVRQPQRP